jgi:ribose-phosphate pyrophosphokinase
MKEPTFFTSKDLKESASSPRGPLCIVSCRSGTRIAASVLQRYQHLMKQNQDADHIPFLSDVDYQFSDTETCVRLEEDIAGKDVFLFQALFDPRSDRGIDQNYMAFLIATRTIRQWGAQHVTAVLPYLAYARQLRSTSHKRETSTAKLMAEFSRQVGVDRLITYHPHTARIEELYPEAVVDILSPLPLFLEQYELFRGRDDVIAIAPDEGARELIKAFGRALNIDYGFASKHRPRPEEAVITEISGDFSMKNVALLLDDMISSGGTVYATIKELSTSTDLQEVSLGISHNLCSPAACERVQELYASGMLSQMLVTNSIPQSREFESLPFVKVMDLSDILARVINRVHFNQPISDLFTFD